MTHQRLPFDLSRIGAGLPATAIEDEFAAALSGGSVILQAPPGTGKTTFLPPLVANLLSELPSGAGAEHRRGAGTNGQQRVAGRVIVTQPRRVAVRSAVRRLAQLSGTRVGEIAGFTVRGERQVTPSTAVEFVTPGVLLRRVLTDPELPGVAAVLLDEVHERSLDTDLLIALFSDLRQLRPDLKVVAMSATVDTDSLTTHLHDDAGGPAAVVTCPSVL